MRAGKRVSVHAGIVLNESDKKVEWSATVSFGQLAESSYPPRALRGKKQIGCVTRQVSDAERVGHSAEALAIPRPVTPCPQHTGNHRIQRIKPKVPELQQLRDVPERAGVQQHDGRRREHK